MAKVEIDEEEVRANQALRATVGAILSNPKAKLLVQQAQKLVNPNAVTPELDQQRVVAEPVDEIRKEIATLRKEREDEKAEREQREKLAALNGNIETGIAALKREGWTEEGIKGVRDLMDKHGILDVEIAAAAFEKKHPPAAPASPSGSGAWNFLEMEGDGDADLKKLIETKGESNVLLDKMIRDSLNETRGASRR